MGAERRSDVAAGEALQLFVGAFVDELARSGVANACICPGSRSTPLALLLRRHPAIKVWTHLDERSAAFFALGIAKAIREPVAVVSTSGTAAVNFAPAVVEAFYARVPLLLLTADRPPELQGVGANQTIDQTRLYGPHAKWFVEMMLPEASAEAIRYARTIACRAADRARSGQPGGAASGGEQESGNRQKGIRITLPVRLAPARGIEGESTQADGNGHGSRIDNVRHGPRHQAAPGRRYLGKAIIAMAG